MADRRVVSTGMGAVTPLGMTVDTFWDGLVEGRSGVTAVSLFDAADHSVRIGAECRDFIPSDHFDRKILKRMDRFAQFALVACEEAVKGAGLAMERIDPERIGVVFGSGYGPARATFSFQDSVIDDGDKCADGHGGWFVIEQGKEEE